MKNLLFKAFYQGRDEESIGAGNCASVALIKAAMFAFGYEVFLIKKDSESYHITLRNNEVVTLNEDELLYASRMSAFILGKYENNSELEEFKRIREYAHLCFAVMCKMAQKYGDYSSRYSKFIIPETYEMAVEILNDGTFTPQVYEFLGLEESVSPVYRYNLISKFRGNFGMVIWTGVHAVYANAGYFDLYGNKKRLTNRVMLSLPGKIVAGVFQIRP